MADISAICDNLGREFGASQHFGGCAPMGEKKANRRTAGVSAPPRTTHRASLERAPRLGLTEGDGDPVQDIASQGQPSSASQSAEAGRAGSGGEELSDYAAALEPFGITNAQAVVAPLMESNWPYALMGKQIERTSREARRRCNRVRQRLKEHGLAAASKWEAGQTIARIVGDYRRERELDVKRKAAGY